MTPYEYIKKEIILCHKMPGEVFDESEVAKALNVSRTPVREAVLRLQAEGYLTIIPRKGTLVSNISINDIKEVYEYRIMLEGEVMKKICSNEDSLLLLKWKNYFESLLDEDYNGLELPVEKDELDDVDKLFHLSLVDILKNKLIKKELNYLMDLSARIRFLTNASNKDRYIKSIEEHISIIDALLNHDGKEASKKMKEHLQNSLEGYKK